MKLYGNHPGQQIELEEFKQLATKEKETISEQKICKIILNIQ